MGQNEAAIADCNEAIRLDPDSAEAYNNRGAAKHELGQYEAAIADCNEAIRLDPDGAKAYSNRGNTKHKMGQYEAAGLCTKRSGWIHPWSKPTATGVTRNRS